MFLPFALLPLMLIFLALLLYSLFPLPFYYMASIFLALLLYSILRCFFPLPFYYMASLMLIFLLPSTIYHSPIFPPLALLLYGILKNRIP